MRPPPLAACLARTTVATLSSTVPTLSPLAARGFARPLASAAVGRVVASSGKRASRLPKAALAMTETAAERIRGLSRAGASAAKRRSRCALGCGRAVATASPIR